MVEFLNNTWPTYFLEVIGKSLVCLAAALCVLGLLRRSSAAVRHLIWALTLGSLLLLPMLCALPKPSPLLLPASPVRLPLLSESFSAPKAHRSPLSSPQSTARSEATQASVASQGPRSLEAELSSWPSLLFWCWAVGFLFVLVRWANAWRAVRRMAKSSLPVTLPSLLSLCAEAAGKIGIRPQVRWLQTPVDGIPHPPMTWGYRRPTVLLPAEVTQWPVERSRAVILHELSHVKRGDETLQTLAQLTCALYWFHPLVWLAARRMRTESERACDDMVLNTGMSGREYAGHLLEVMRTLSRRGSVSRVTATMADSPRIEARLRAILDAGRNRRGMSRRAILSVLLAAGPVFMGLAWTGIVGTAQPVQQKPARVKIDPLLRPETYPAVTYEAVIEEAIGKQIQVRYVHYDRGKFCFGRIPGAPSPKTPGFFEFYNGSTPAVVWEYHSGIGQAWPDMASCWEALQRAVRQHGEAAICARYHLPDDVNFDTTWHRYDARIPAWSPDPRLTWTSRGTEMVSGFRCEVHEGRFDPPNAFATKSKDGRSIEGIFPRVERVWVEPRTKLILRSEVQEEAVNGIKMIAANRRHFVKKLRFPERLPASLFELPPGVTVRLPGVLKDMPLPKGTRRVLITGKFAETSIDPKGISQKARQKP